jgi:two-component system chemotaxis sensor kinase CheA
MAVQQRCRAAAAAPAAGASDLITDDEFEALLDQLHGGNAPTAVAPAKKADDGLISEDEFEALLDQLHGGAAPGAKPAAAVARHRSPPRARRPHRAPAAAGRQAAGRGRTHRARGHQAPGCDRQPDRRTGAVAQPAQDPAHAPARRGAGPRRVHLDIATARLQSAVMRTRMQPVGKVFSRFPKVARDVARSLKKEVDLELIGAETELDRNLVEALADPLVHLVRNAIDHGVEMPDLREAQGKPRMGHAAVGAAGR